MKRFTTIICCLAFMVSGVMLAIKSTGERFGSNTVMAATIPLNYNGPLPLDLQLDLDKRLEKDTVIVHDSIYVKCNHKERVKVLKPDRVTDTLYLPMPMPAPMVSMPVNNQFQGNREEKIPDELCIGSKPHSVTLTVDGQVVYKSENDIHSTGDRQ